MLIGHTSRRILFVILGIVLFTAFPCARALAQSDPLATQQDRRN